MNSMRGMRCCDSGPRLFPAKLVGITICALLTVLQVPVGISET